MTVNTNSKWVALSDSAIISAVGQYLKHARLAQNRTQAQIATEAGVNRWTLSQIERGESITLASLIQILRALDALHLLEIFTVEEKISPIAYAKAMEKQRKRARPKNKADNTEDDLGW